jgi:mono/diheme cytochrome c family protein
MKVWIAIAAVLVLVGIGVRAQDQPSRSVWDGVFTAEQAERGSGIYRRACASCHGDELTGGESAPALVGGAFLANWDGLTAGDLFERIRTSMPQDRPGRLSRQENAAVLAFMLSMNKFPEGKTELPQRTELLKDIRFEASKPDSKK